MLLVCRLGGLAVVLAVVLLEGRGVATPVLPAAVVAPAVLVPAAALVAPPLGAAALALLAVGAPGVLARTAALLAGVPLGEAAWESVFLSAMAFTNTGFTLSADGRRLVVVATLDNLLKGAATQALQNLNLAFGLPETMGIPT